MTIPSWFKRIGTKIEEWTSEIAGGIIGGFIVNKLENNQPVIVDGKPVKTLDMKKLRTEAPHIAKSLEDEAEFIAIKNGLNPGLRKSLEQWMASLGNNQRADVILTVAEMTVRKDLHNDPIENRKLAREVAFKSVEQLAAEPDVEVPGNPRSPWLNKDVHAFGFKFMKAREDEYLAAQLTTRATEALVGLVDEFRAAKQEWDVWATETTNDTIRPYTRDMRQYLRTRPHGFVATVRRMFDLPWEQSAPGAAVDVADDDYRPFGRRIR